jgi:hypothetical protein
MRSFTVTKNNRRALHAAVSICYGDVNEAERRATIDGAKNKGGLAAALILIAERRN